MEWMLANTSYFYPHSTNKVFNSFVHSLMTQVTVSHFKPACVDGDVGAFLRYHQHTEEASIKLF